MYYVLPQRLTPRLNLRCLMRSRSGVGFWAERGCTYLVLLTPSWLPFPVHFLPSFVLAGFPTLRSYSMCCWAVEAESILWDEGFLGGVGEPACGRPGSGYRVVGQLGRQFPTRVSIRVQAWW